MTSRRAIKARRVGIVAPTRSSTIIGDLSGGSPRGVERRILDRGQHGADASFSATSEGRSLAMCSDSALVSPAPPTVSTGASRGGGRRSRRPRARHSEYPRWSGPLNAFLVERLRFSFRQLVANPRPRQRAIVRDWVNAISNRTLVD